MGRIDKETLDGRAGWRQWIRVWDGGGRSEALDRSVVWRDVGL